MQANHPLNLGKEIVFIDQGVEEYASTAAAVRENTNIHYLDQAGQPIQDIEAILRNYKGVESVHLVCHGSPGRLHLGNMTLSVETLEQYRQQIASWFQHLPPVQLILYGCEVGKGKIGERFLAMLRELTQARIIASPHKVGSPSQGGSWCLVDQADRPFPITLFGEEFIANYAGVFAPGDLDETFANQGLATTPFGPGIDYANNLAIDRFGNILLAGSADMPGTQADFALARYLPNGHLDHRFGTAGKVTTDFNGLADFANSMLSDQDGNYVLVGRAKSSTQGDDIALARYNSQGLLDPSFGHNGKITIDVAGFDDVAYSAILDAAGRILVTGYVNDGNDFDIAVLRFTANGHLDTTFGINGIVTTDFKGGDDYGCSIALDSSGNIVVGGFARNGNHFDFALARYQPDGTPDQSFGNAGRVLTDFNGGASDFASTVLVLGDGKILLGGHIDPAGSHSQFALARYTNTGHLDITFGSNGRVVTDFGGHAVKGLTMAVDTAGKIILGGHGSSTSDGEDFALARYNANGTLDTTFSGDGLLKLDFGGVNNYGFNLSLNAQGDILFGGSTEPDSQNEDFALIKVEGDRVERRSQGLGLNRITGEVARLSLSSSSLAIESTPLARTIPDPHWRLQAIGDLNDDGQGDILLRHFGSGENLAFFMDANGSGIASESLVGRKIEDPNWEIVGTGDFDRDGHGDIILQNRLADQILAWYMDGQGGIKSERLIGRAIGDPNWKVEGLADFNGDQAPDLLLRHYGSGQNIVWQMQDHLIQSESVVGRVISDFDWQFQGIGDFDNNGVVDLMLRHGPSGQGLLWSMQNPSTIAQEILMPTIPHSSWQIVI